MHRRRPHSAPDSRALPLAREPEINSVAPTHSSCLLKWRPQGVQPGQPGGRPEMLPPGRRKHGTRTRLRVHFPAIRRKTASPPQYAAPKDRATCCRAPFIASEGEAARTYQMERPRSNNGPRKAFNFSKPSRNVCSRQRASRTMRNRPYPVLKCSSCSWPLGAATSSASVFAFL